jgi:hypothetical protein
MPGSAAAAWKHSFSYDLIQSKNKSPQAEYLRAFIKCVSIKRRIMLCEVLLLGNYIVERQCVVFV